MVLIFLMFNSLIFTDSFADYQGGKEKKEKGQKEFYLEPEGPLNHESLDLDQLLFTGEPSLGFNLRNPLEGTSGGNTCSSCSH